MANPTTYFGWVMPTATDLVTDLPADFNVFGQGVDTSLQYLLGGTTGQVLSKTSNTNMAFTWVTPTDQTPLTTKGDLFTFTTVDARLGVGTNGQVLTADSTAATGLKWATASGGGKVLQVVMGTYSTQTLTSSTSYVDTGLSVSITPTLSTSKVLVLVSNSAYVANSASASSVNGGFQIVRASTNIVTLSGAMQTNINANNGAMSSMFSYAYLDSPATTSATTYKLQQKVDNSNGFVITSLGSTTSNITVLEIGA